MAPGQKQCIIISGIYTSFLTSDALDENEFHATLKLLRNRNIPLIFTTDRTAEEAFSILHNVDYPCPLVIESGGAIYIPNDALKVPYNYQRTVEEYKIIELGLERRLIQEKIRSTTHDGKFKIRTFSDITPDEIPAQSQLSHTDFLAAQTRLYSEPILLEEGESLESFAKAMTEEQLRIHARDSGLIITGDHDAGSAVRFLVQLYREECSPKEIVTIGLGDGLEDAAILHAVDLPVLLRSSDGQFDSRVGRRGLRFTKNPGHLGWGQAVTSLINEQFEV